METQEKEKQLVEEKNLKFIEKLKQVNTKKEVDQKYINDIFWNIIKAIISIAYFLLINVANANMQANHFERFMQLCTMILLFITIYIFEKAYKKDDDVLAIHGIEILMLSACTLTMQYTTKKFKFDFPNYSIVLGYIFAIYFVLKSITIYTKGRKEIVDNYSDIREILKKEEPIKKEATKKRKKANSTTKKRKVE